MLPERLGWGPRFQSLEISYDVQKFAVEFLSTRFQLRTILLSVRLPDVDCAARRESNSRTSRRLK
jgi:hypothetical protein